MSPTEITAVAIKRLIAEIRADRIALSSQREDLRRFHRGGLPVSHERSAALALALDWSYTALESVLDRIVRTLEGTRPQGEDWHKGLLDDAGLDIEGVRPPILSEPSLRAAHELRRFRHFLHHAYARVLNPQRVWEVAGEWLRSADGLEADLDQFEAFLRRLAA
jgi:hypothetical protein